MIKNDKKSYKKIKKIKHVVKILEETINLLFQDEIDAKRANAIGYLSNQITHAIEVGELEKRVIELEQQTNSKNKVNVKE